MNKVFLLGRLCRNPALSYTENQTAVCKFYLAVDKPYKADRGENEPTADFLPCVCFGKRGETIAKHFKQGNKIMLQGRIATSTYMKDDEKRHSYSIQIEDFEFCQNKEKSEGETAEGFTEVAADDGEDLPF